MATMLTRALRAFVVTCGDRECAQCLRSNRSAPPSVLPTGGGQALLDTSDSVILLLDHQAGLFQTVKDVGPRPAARERHDAREACHAC